MKSNSAGSLVKITAEREICVLHDARGGSHVLEFLTVLPGVADKLDGDRMRHRHNLITGHGFFFPSRFPQCASSPASAGFGVCKIPNTLTMVRSRSEVKSIHLCPF